MRLTERNIERVKKASEKICCYGKITLVIQDGLLIDIITESRERVSKDGPGIKPPNNSRENHA